MGRDLSTHSWCCSLQHSAGHGGEAQKQLLIEKGVWLLHPEQFTSLRHSHHSPAPGYNMEWEGERRWKNKRKAGTFSFIGTCLMIFKVLGWHDPLVRMLQKIIRGRDKSAVIRLFHLKCHCPAWHSSGTLLLSQHRRIWAPHSGLQGMGHLTTLPHVSSLDCTPVLKVSSCSSIYSHTGSSDCRRIHLWVQINIFTLVVDIAHTNQDIEPVHHLRAFLHYHNN